MLKEYTGQEIIDWIAENPNNDISRVLMRKYYKFDFDLDPEWHDAKCNLNPERKYKIRDYVCYKYDTWGSYPAITYKIIKVPIKQPRRSSLKKGDKQYGS